MSSGPINELADALRVQAIFNQRGAIAAAAAAAVQGVSFALGAFWPAL